MKKLLSTLMFSTLGSIVGSMLLTRFGASTEPHWARAVLFGMLFGLVALFWERINKGKQSWR